MLSIGHPSSLQGIIGPCSEHGMKGCNWHAYLQVSYFRSQAAAFCRAIVGTYRPLLAPIGRCWPRSATPPFLSTVPFHLPHKEPFSEGDHVNPVLLTQYCSGDKIENEMGKACSAYGGEERRVRGFGRET